VTELTVLPDIEKYQNTTSVKGPTLGFHAVTAPEECVADIEWRIEGNAGALVGSDKTARFTPTISQDDAPDDAVIVANDKRDTTGRTFGAVKVFVEPLSIEITTITTPSEKVEPKGEDSFIAEDVIEAYAVISPPAANDVFKSRIEWTVPKGGMLGLSDVKDAGGKLRFTIQPWIAASGRNQIPLKYYLIAKLQIDDDVSVENMRMIQQDRRDVLREEYTPYDVYVNRVPTRQEVLDQNTEGFKYVNPGNFAFNEVDSKSGDYSDLVIFKIAQNLQNVRDDLWLVREDDKESISVKSGYRNPVYNQTLEPIGAAHNSNHQFGVAADIAVEDFNGDGKTPYRVEVGDKMVLHAGVLNAAKEDVDWAILADIADQNEANYIEPYKITGTWVHMGWH